MMIALHGETITNCNLLTHIDVTRETGYDAVEIAHPHIERYLKRGLTVERLLDHLDGFPVVAMGYIADIERQEPAEYAALMAETEKKCQLAQELDCPNIQLLTGPHRDTGYKGLAGYPWSEMRDLTAKNLKAIGNIGAQYDVSFYLEPISWAPLHSLEQGLEVLDAAGCDNIGLVIDFWHMWITGTTPDDIAKLDKEVINGIHFCDSLPTNGAPISHVQREVWPGGGSIPLKEWVDAVVATRYDGWWSPELHSPKHWEMDMWRTAYNLREMLEYLLV